VSKKGSYHCKMKKTLKCAFYFYMIMKMLWKTHDNPWNFKFTIVGILKFHGLAWVFHCIFMVMSLVVLCLSNKNVWSKFCLAANIMTHTVKLKVWMSYKIATGVIQNGKFVWLLWQICVTFILSILQCMHEKCVLFYKLAKFQDFV